MSLKNFLPAQVRTLAGQLGPGRIVLLYAVFAVLWVVGSSQLMAFSTGDPLLQGRIELIKGLAFVGVTSALLYLLLRIWRQPGAADSVLQRDLQSSGLRRLVLPFVGLLLAVLLLSTAAVAWYGTQLEQKAYDDLVALAELTSGQVKNWLAEQHGDGAVLMADATFSGQVVRLLPHQVSTLRSKPVLEKFDSLRSAYGYDSVLLLDTEGSVLLTLGDRTGVPAELQAVLHQAVRSRQVQRSNLYADQNGRMQLDWVVPISAPGLNARPVAAVVLRVVPERFLFPLIQRQATANTSRENLLIRREKDAALYLTPLRNAANGMPNLRWPLNDRALIASTIIGDQRQSKPGTMQGIDYRGVTVLAAHHPVAGTDWQLIAKIDRAEVMQPLYTLAFLIGLVIFFAMLAVGAVMALLWWWQRRMHQLALLTHQAKTDRLLRQFFDLPFIGIAMISPDTKNTPQFNDHLCTILGYSREELSVKNWADLTHPDDSGAETCEIERILCGESEAYSMNKRFIHSDGSILFASVDVKCVRHLDNTVDFFVATVANITGRRANEAKIQRLTQLYTALSLCNQAIVRCTDETALFAQICHDAVQFGNMTMAWIGLSDDASGQVRPVACYGIGTDYLDNITISADAGQHNGCDPISAVIRSGQPYWCQDFQTDPCTAPWRKNDRHADWRAMATLPLSRNGVVIGVFSLYADETQVFDAAVRTLLVEMTADISYALDNFAREAARQQAVLAYQESEAFNISVLDSLVAHIVVLDAQGMIVAVNQSWRHFAGMSDATELIGHEVGFNYLNWCATVSENSSITDTAAIEAGIRAVLAGTLPEFHMEYPCHTPHKQCWFEMHVYPMQDSSAGVVITHEDITERKRHQAQLHLAAQVFEQSGEGITVTDVNRNIVMINRAFTTITGYDADEVLGKDPRIMSSGRQDQAFYKNMWGVINAQNHWQGEIWNRRKDGTIYPELLSISKVFDNHGTLTNYIGIFSDISQYKAAQAHIERLAQFDVLTGLPNRLLLNDRASQALSVAHRNQMPLALMFIDLDRFKNVNDSLGHRIGDGLLSALAQRLCATVREQDTVARLGGDEFVLLLPDTDAAGAAHFAAKLLEAVVQPYQIEQHELTITSSIGVAMYPGDGMDFESLSKCADIAMYRAKQEGRNGFCFFTSEMQARSVRTLQLENALRRALERNQLSLHYQPQISLRNDAIIGAEALLRWHHPELGMISPAEFIPIAEDSGQILQLGEWVLRTAVRQCRDWMALMPVPMTMAVNLSAVQFRHPQLPELVMDILEQEGLPPSCLELELTEGVAMDNPQAAIVVMDRLHACGIRMSIDDFGTGYSSLAYLQRFQVYKLKIDQTFVRDISTDSDNETIISAIISMARSLGLQTIAEGVETVQQLAFLRDQGCNEVQGYHFSKPLPAEQFEVLLREWQTVST